MRDPLFFEERMLPGGAKLFHQHREMSWCGVIVTVLAGHLHDEVGKEGTAHLLEHQVSNGRIGDLPAMSSEDLKSWLGRSRMMASLGATSLFWTRYGGRAENGNVGALARFLTDIVFRPGLDGDLEHEREIVRAERGHSIDDRSERIGHAVDRAAFRNHRRSTATGLPEDVVLDAITRADIETFRTRYYAPANVRVVSVGGVTTDEMEAVLRGLVPESRRGEIATSIDPLIVPPPDPRELYMTREDGRLAENASIRWVWRMPADFHRLGPIAASALQGLLHQRVREDLRAVYGISAQHGYHYDHTSFEIRTKVDIEKIGAVRSEVERILGDCDAIARSFHRKSEELDVDETFFDRTCVSILESAAFQVCALGRIATMAELLDEAKSVTEADVLDYVRTKLDPDDTQIIIVERQ